MQPQDTMIYPRAVKEALFYTDKPNELDHFKLFDEPLPYGFESKANEDASDQCPYCEGEGCEDCLQTGLVDGELRDVRYPELKEEGGNPNHDPSNGQFTSEGFDQGLYGYVDAKCKTCGIEFDSIPDMDDHYAMNSDHISNLNDLDSDIPNSD